ncbi:hypothetical protein V8E36_001531 [Tilletia maclaganii]
MPPKITAEGPAAASGANPVTPTRQDEPILADVMALLLQLSDRVGVLEKRSTRADSEDPFGPDSRTVTFRGDVGVGAQHPYAEYTRMLQPGPNPGAQGRTPATTEPLRARGASGMLIPVTPVHQGPPQARVSESATRATDPRGSATERAAAARAASQEPTHDEGFKAFSQRLFAPYFRVAESRLPGATDEQLVSEVEKQLAVDWDD